MKKSAKRRTKRGVKKYRRNPATAKRRARKYRRNPMPASFKGAIKKENIISTLALGGGLIVGLKAQKYLHALSFMMPWRKYNGIIPMLAGIILAAKMKKPAMQKLGLGIAASGVYDLASQNITALALMPVEGVDLVGMAGAGVPTMPMGGATYDTYQGEETVIVGTSDGLTMLGDDRSDIYDF